MKRLLIIDDEITIIETIRVYFEDKGFIVAGAQNCTEAYDAIREKPDIILLDILMPGTDGIHFCRQVREEVLCPILFLSARTEEESKIKGLSSGGDDYITKPFSMPELYARVMAHIRRENRPKNNFSKIYFDSIWVDYGRKEVGVADKTLNFTKKEYMILELLSLHPQQIFNQEQIYDSAWDYDAFGDAKTSVTEHIKRIRKKLRAFSEKEFIETIWGIGYRWIR